MWIGNGDASQRLGDHGRASRGSNDTRGDMEDCAQWDGKHYVVYPPFQEPPYILCGNCPRARD